jgi:hypothetical protein
MKYHYTYISFDINGNKYHGVRTSRGKTPWEDGYLGSFEDKTFEPIGKFVQRIFSKRRTAEYFEAWFHRKYDVANSAKWINQINSPCGWGELCVVNSIKTRKGKKMCVNINTGERKFLEKCEKEWTTFKRSHDKGKKWWKHKITGKLCKAFDCPGGDWEQKGNNTTGTKWWIHVETGQRKRSKECPGPNWTNKNARNPVKGSGTKGKIWVEEIKTGQLLAIKKEQFDLKLHKKSGPNAGKRWTLDPISKKRIYVKKSE